MIIDQVMAISYSQRFGIEDDLSSTVTFELKLYTKKPKHKF
jgi:hypothetical protein